MSTCLVQKTSTETRFISYNNANQRTEQTRFDGTTVNYGYDGTAVYDGNGNLTAADLRTCGYYREDQLIAVTEPGLILSVTIFALSPIDFCR
jgi:hypothetical protein